MKHMNEDGMVDHAAYMKDVAIEKKKNNEFNSPMQPETVTHTVDNDEDYDPANYWLMLAGELEWDHALFMRHASIEKKRNEEPEATEKPRKITHMSNNEEGEPPTQPQPADAVEDKPVNSINNGEKKPQSKEVLQAKSNRMSDIDKGLKGAHKELDAPIKHRAVNHMNDSKKNEHPAQQQPTNAAESKQVTNVINNEKSQDQKATQEWQLHWNPGEEYKLDYSDEDKLAAEIEWFNNNYKD